MSCWSDMDSAVQIVGVPKFAPNYDLNDVSQEALKELYEDTLEHISLAPFFLEYLKEL